MPYKFNPFTGQFDLVGTPDGGAAATAQSILVEEEAGETINGGRAVIKANDGKVYLADKDTPAHADKLYGIAVGTIMTGAVGYIRLFGEVTGLAGLTEDETLWLGNDGVVTHIPTSTGFLVKIGHSIDTTSMFVDIEEPIIRI